MKSVLYLCAQPPEEIHFKVVMVRPSEEEIKRLIQQMKDFEKVEQRLALIHPSPLQLLEQFKKQMIWVEAAGGAVFRKDRSLLLIKRLGRWDLPKGKLEAGENAEEGALREVEEECNIQQLSIESELSPTYHVYYRNGWTLKKTHWFQMLCGKYDKAKPQLEEDIEEIAWLDLKYKAVKHIETYPSIMEVLLQL